MRTGAVAATCRSHRRQAHADRQPARKASTSSSARPRLTLKIEELAERVIRPAMVRLANQIDVDMMNLYHRHPELGRTTGDRC